MFQMFLGTKGQENARSTKKRPGSVLPEAWSKRVPKLINFRPFIFSPETLCDLPKDKGHLRERHNDLKPQSRGQFNSPPPELSQRVVTNSQSYILFGFPTSARSAIQSLFMGMLPQLSSTLGLLVQLLNMKLHFAHSVNMTQHGKT